MLSQVNPPSTLQSGPHPSLGSRFPSSHSSPLSTLPLPQVTAQAWVAPAAVRQDGSLVQVFEQPVASPKKRPFGPLQSAPPGPWPAGYGAALFVPQSQPSVPSFLPLPQIDAVQTLGVPVLQVAPGSIEQVDEQPSPSALLPSSHASPPFFMPSPQAGTQGRPGTRHSKPVSTILQVAVQPSPNGEQQ